MRRRAFVRTVATLGLAALAPAGRAQSLRRIGMLVPISFSAMPKVLLDAFHAGLREFGWVEGRNLVRDERSSDGRDERFPALAAELIAFNPDVMIAVTVPAIRAAQDATKKIPIVMLLASDPVGMGLVASLAHPGGNSTGLASSIQTVAPKRIELLKEAMPGLARATIVLNPANPAMRGDADASARTATRLGIKTRSLEIRSPEELGALFDSITKDRPEALIVVADPLTVLLRAQIVEFAAKNRLPAVFGTRDFVVAGGLMSYGTDVADLFRRSGYYIDRLLKGARAADLPVEQPTKFDFVINLKAARALGLTLPHSLLVRADHVIE